MKKDVEYLLRFIRSLEKRIDRLESIRSKDLREEYSKQLIIPGGGGGGDDATLQTHRHLNEDDLGIAWSVLWPTTDAEASDSCLFHVIASELFSSEIVGSV